VKKKGRYCFTEKKKGTNIVSLELARPNDDHLNWADVAQVSAHTAID
jgi:hypothetical protein